MTVLVTGGAGYIGSHTVLALLQKNYNVIVLDNLVNSSQTSLSRVEILTDKAVTFYRGDIRDADCLQEIFKHSAIDAVIHFAGLKAVGDSVRQPVEYYQNNVAGTLTLLEEMRRAGIKKLIFSSSATVYGIPEQVPLTERSRTGKTTNPYGTSKWMVEQVLQDLAQAEPDFAIAALRYFNPVGAHESGLIGEDPAGIPTNLLPYITQVAIGKLQKLSIFGNDYPTRDGTGIRDYIHVMDLAEGHLSALRHLDNMKGYSAFNLGTGAGYSVMEMLQTFARISGRKIPYQILPRREGDVAECWSDPSLAAEILGWKATRKLENMLADAWRWQQNNPQGYG